jgi:phosphoribulokinase
VEGVVRNHHREAAEAEADSHHHREAAEAAGNCRRAEAAGADIHHREAVAEAVDHSWFDIPFDDFGFFTTGQLRSAKSLLPLVK